MCSFDELCERAKRKTSLNEDKSLLENLQAVNSFRVKFDCLLPQDHSLSAHLLSHY